MKNGTPKYWTTSQRQKKFKKKQKPFSEPKLCK
jgi:hypothetical protein